MTSVIHDIGYQRYQGPRLGRGYAVRSLFTHSLRGAYGLGRTAKAKIFPWLVAGLVGGVAVVLTAIHAGFGERLLSYDEFMEAMSLLLILFVAVVAPELVSRDLRTGVLHLYFSRPLRRTDYALAKLAAMIAAVWLLLAVPLLVMLLGAVLSVDGWSAILAEFRGFGSGIGYAVLTAVVYSSVAVAIASLLSRRAVAAGAIVAVFLLTTPIVGLLEETGGESVQQLAGVFSPMTQLMGIRGWLGGDVDVPYPGPYGWVYGVVTLGLIVASVGLLLARYRRVQR